MMRTCSFSIVYLAFCSLLCTFALRMNKAITEDIIEEYDILDNEDSLEWLAAESLWRGFTDELQELHYLKGAKFINQLRLIVHEGDFQPIEGETNIFSAISEQSPDYDNLLNAARKAVEHGNKVYILPNPKGIRTADFIFERKGVYKMFDLKTIIGKNSVGNRLLESIGQTNHVLLNMATNYDPRLLAKDIQIYFQVNSQAREVLILKGNKELSVSRQFVMGKDYIKMFIKRYLK
ncbi:hypothetical protein SAMN06298211_10226 [Prevotellaceae bacterium MN60]|nr:hypothetical protein SAMN06298211_10226 [Prevotellaceae bacterium MN60]